MNAGMLQGRSVKVLNLERKKYDRLRWGHLQSRALKDMETDWVASNFFHPKIMVKLKNLVTQRIGTPMLMVKVLTSL